MYLLIHLAIELFLPRLHLVYLRLPLLSNVRYHLRGIVITPCIGLICVRLHRETATTLLEGQLIEEFLDQIVRVGCLLMEVVEGLRLRAMGCGSCGRIRKELGRFWVGFVGLLVMGRCKGLKVGYEGLWRLLENGLRVAVVEGVLELMLVLLLLLLKKLLLLGKELGLRVEEGRRTWEALGLLLTEHRVE